MQIIFSSRRFDKHGRIQGKIVEKLNGAMKHNDSLAFTELSKGRWMNISTSI
ncbi:MAG: hypothetical protein IPG02_17570 [Ignavibacteria bacterium]|nr:hypothetical protein [Ignavibacteria bacterium]